ncbi:MAG TPA: hypothetical protein VFA33_12250 [Bryobacteraceae bacterium]|nr:hypothetical protein [Bryobacteraceae bacterium]
MRSLSRVALSISALVVASATAQAQSVISAHSGLLHYVEGRVYLGDKQVESKFGAFPEVKENQVLRTEEGRAEVLLTPGVFLRVGENSSFKMITNRLIDTRLELLKGTAIVEADELLKDNGVTVAYQDAAVRVVKKGLYRIDSDPAQLRVYNGEASVEAAGKTVAVKEGKLISLDSQLAMEKFDKTTGDALNRWSRRRGEYLSMANVSAAKSVLDAGGMWNTSGWYWNPFYGTYTFLPMQGSFYSPYGYRLWSPFSVYPVYYGPRYGYYGGGSAYNRAGLGYGSIPHTSSGYSGAIANSAPVSRGGVAASSPSMSSSAGSAPISRGGGGGGGPRH